MRSLLVSRPDRIGDVVISTSCLAPLRERFPRARLYLLVRPAMAGLLRGHPLLEDLLLLDEGTGEAALAERLRACDLDTVVHLNPHPLVQAAAERAGVARRIGYGRRPAGGLSETVPDRRKLGLRLEARCNFDLLARLEVPEPASLAPSLHPDPAALERARARGLAPRCYALLHLAAFGDKPRVPPRTFAAVARVLAGEYGLRLVLIGADAAEPSREPFLEALGPGAGAVLDLCGATDLAELAWLARDAAITVSRDSGPAHIAAAMGCATVTVFAEPNQVNSSARWMPLGPRVEVVEQRRRQHWWEGRRRYARRVARDTGPAQILDAARRALDAREAGPPGAGASPGGPHSP